MFSLQGKPGYATLRHAACARQEEPSSTKVRLLSQTGGRTHEWWWERKPRVTLGAEVYIEGGGQGDGGPRASGRAEFQSILPAVCPQSAQEYRQRSLLEKELLFFAYDVFGIPFVDPVSQGAGVRGGQGMG